MCVVCIEKRKRKTKFSIASNDDDLVDGNGAHNIPIIYGKWYYRAISKLKCTDYSEYWIPAVAVAATATSTTNNMDRKRRKHEIEIYNWRALDASGFDVCAKCVELVVIVFYFYFLPFLFFFLSFFVCVDTLGKVFVSQTNQWTTQKYFRVPDENHDILVLLIRAVHVHRSYLIIILLVSVSHFRWYTQIGGGAFRVTEFPNFRISEAMVATESNLEN